MLQKILLIYTYLLYRKHKNSIISPNTFEPIVGPLFCSKYSVWRSPSRITRALARKGLFGQPMMSLPPRMTMYLQRSSKFLFPSLSSNSNTPYRTSFSMCGKIVSPTTHLSTTRPQTTSCIQGQTGFGVCLKYFKTPSKLLFCNVNVLAF